MISISYAMMNGWYVRRGCVKSVSIVFQFINLLVVKNVICKLSFWNWYDVLLYAMHKHSAFPSLFPFLMMDILIWSKICFLVLVRFGLRFQFLRVLVGPWGLVRIYFFFNWLCQLLRNSRFRMDDVIEAERALDRGAWG